MAASAGSSQYGDANAALLGSAGQLRSGWATRTLGSDAAGPWPHHGRMAGCMTELADVEQPGKAGE